MRCEACGHSNPPEGETCFGCGRNIAGIVKGTLLCNRYEILVRLGRGGMGTVYSAHDRELDYRVAVKILRGDLGGSTHYIERFRREIRLARGVRHPNVCGVHEYGQDGQHRFMVMEYIAGTDFRELIRTKGPMAPADAVAVTCQVAAGLQAIHDAGIVHRDLKTANLMRTATGMVRVMDFGIAKEVDSPMSGLTAMGLVVGTPEYMSPEQVRAENVDARSDIYALGIILYELLTGSPPFHGERSRVLRSQLQDPPPLDRTSIPRRFVPVIAKALDKRKERRFESSAAFIEALMAADADAGAASARPISVPTLATQTIATWRVWRTGRVAAFGAVAISAIAVALGHWPGVTPAAIEPAPTNPPTATAVRTAGPQAEIPPRETPLPVRPLVVAKGDRLPTNRSPDGKQDPSGPSNARQGGQGLGSVHDRGPIVSRDSGATLADRPPSQVPVAPPPRPSAEASLAESHEPQEAVKGRGTQTAPATVRLVVRPWAEVTLNGKNLGTTPLAPISIAPGSYVLMFTNPKYGPLQRRFTASSGEAITIEVDMRR